MRWRRSAVTVLEEYVADLDAHLVGPPRAKVDLMTEVRDHLADARDAYRRAGFDDASAERRAVAEFGDVRAVAPEFQSELGLAQSRRTALLMFAVLLGQPLLWRDWLPGFEEQSAQLSDLAAVVDRLVEVLGALSIVGAIGCVLASGVGTRWVVRRRLIVRVSAVYALGTCVLLASLALVLSSQTSGGSTAVLVAMAWTVALLILPLSVVVRSAARALSAA